MTCRQILARPAQWWHIFAIVFLLLAPIALALDREPPYTRMLGSISPVNPSPGDIIEIRWSIRKNRDCASVSGGNLSRYIVDADKVVVELAKVPTLFGTEVFQVDPVTNMATIIRPLKLPHRTALGPAVYKSSARFICDFFHLQSFHPIVIDGPEIPFNVAPRPQ